MKKIIWVCSCLLALAIVVTKINGRGRSEDAKAVQWPHIDQTQYVGSTKCADCHKTHYDGWKDPAHNKMIRPPIAAGPIRTILADFSQASPDRKFELKDVKWVIGHRWKQRFIGEVAGQEVVFPAQWSIKEKKWQPYQGKSVWWYPTHQDLATGYRTASEDFVVWAMLGQMDNVEHVAGKGYRLKKR